ncbi:MAG: hypothetical protein CMC15_14830 [Flavobacteriaceae bacterium]|nr:hypothetical protein [Flavobacteriaceae bacterium]
MLTGKIKAVYLSSDVSNDANAKRTEDKMAYMNQDKKKAIAPKVKEICKRHGVKATLSVYNGSTLCLNIKSGDINFFADGGFDYEKERGQIQVNEYHYQDHFTGKAKAFLSEVIPALNSGNHDNSDIMTDYFDVGWWISVNVGQFQKPYIFTGAKEEPAPVEPTPQPLTMPSTFYAQGIGNEQ